jgi:hypothetical protein
VQWQGPDLWGFPFALHIELADVTLARGTPAIFEIDAPLLSAEAKPWDLAHWHLIAPGGAHGRAQYLPDPIAAALLQAEIEIGPVLSKIDVVAQDIGAGALHAGAIDALLELPRKRPASYRDFGLAGQVRLSHARLAKPLKPLGDTIEAASLQGKFMGALPPGDPPTALAAWRDSGGTVEIQRASLQWGPLALELNGTLALDKDMQPIAAMTGTIVDHVALVDAAIAAGMVPAKRANLIKLVLDLLAKPGPDGKRRVTAPLTVEDGKLAIGKVEIGPVPRIQWK